MCRQRVLADNSTKLETIQETRHIPVLVLHRNEGAQPESLSMDYTVPLPTSKYLYFCIYMYISPLIVRVNVYSTYIPTPNKKQKKIKQTLTQTRTQHKHKTRKAEQYVQRKP